MSLDTVNAPMNRLYFQRLGPGGWQELVLQAEQGEGRHELRGRRGLGVRAGHAFTCPEREHSALADLRALVELLRPSRLEGKECLHDLLRSPRRLLPAQARGRKPHLADANMAGCNGFWDKS